MRWVRISWFAIAGAACGWSQQYTQQGPKLVGTGYIGNSTIYQGDSVAISSDGSTAVVGANGDNNFLGAAWVFTRTNGGWSQQAKLMGNDYTGSFANPNMGWSAGISADGNTVIIGGEQDGSDGFTGAAWIFTRSNGSWKQQGNKLIGTGADNFASQGFAVAMSGTEIRQWSVVPESSSAGRRTRMARSGSTHDQRAGCGRSRPSWLARELSGWRGKDGRRPSRMTETP
jgi:hypothetical protein